MVHTRIFWLFKSLCNILGLYLCKKFMPNATSRAMHIFSFSLNFLCFSCNTEYKLPKETKSEREIHHADKTEKSTYHFEETQILTPQDFVKFQEVIPN